MKYSFEKTGFEIKLILDINKVSKYKNTKQMYKPFVWLFLRMQYCDNCLNLDGTL